MRKLIVSGLIVALGVVVASSLTPFRHWPALYDAAENAVVKRGQREDGQENGLLYFRIGWGNCLAVYQNELTKLYSEAPKDRYINLRDYAVNELRSDAWNAEHQSNCPSAPLEVKAYWRGSRPIYYREWNEEYRTWYKGKKSPYRVMADKALPAYTCTRHNAASADGSQSNYWRLADDAQVYDAAGTYTLISDLDLPNDRQLVTICEDQDVDILDYRF